MRVCRELVNELFLITPGQATAYAPDLLCWPRPLLLPSCLESAREGV